MAGNLKAFKQKMQTLTDEVETLKAELQAKTEEFLTEQKRRAEAMVDIERLRKNVKFLTRNKTDMQDQATTDQSEKETRRPERRVRVDEAIVNELKQEIQEKEEFAKITMAKCERASKRMSVLESDLHSAREQAEINEETTTHVKQKLAEATSEISNLKFKLECVEDDKETSEIALAAASEELVLASGSVKAKAKLEKKLSRDADTIKNLEERLRHAETLLKQGGVTSPTGSVTSPTADEKSQRRISLNLSEDAKVKPDGSMTPRKDHLKAFRDKMQELNATVDQLKGELEKQKQLCELETQRRETAERALANITNASDSKDKARKIQDGAACVGNSEKEELKLKLKQSEHSLERMTAMHQESSQKLKSIECELQQARSLIKTLEEQNKQLHGTKVQNIKQDNKSPTEDFTIKLETLQEEVDRLQHTVKEKKRLYESERKRRETAESEAERLKLEASNYSNKATGLSTERLQQSGDKSPELSALTQKYQILNDKYQNLKDDNETTEMALTAATDELDVTYKINKDKDKALKVLEKKTKSDTEKLKQLEERVKGGGPESKTNPADLQKLTEEMTVLRQKFKDSEDAKNFALAKVKLLTTKVEKANTDAVASVRRLLEKSTMDTGSTDQLNERLKAAEEKTKKTEAKYQNITKQIIAMADSIRNAEK